ncbi:MAG: hypothetical protein ACOYW3_00495, partial [Bacteroidota bacterium]
WNEFRNPEWTKVKSSLKTPLLFDGRNLFDPEKLAGMGFDYLTIGRPYVSPQRTFAEQEELFLKLAM